MPTVSMCRGNEPRVTPEHPIDGARVLTFGPCARGRYATGSAFICRQKLRTALLQVVVAEPRWLTQLALRVSGHSRPTCEVARAGLPQRGPPCFTREVGGLATTSRPRLCRSSSCRGKETQGAENRRKYKPQHDRHQTASAAVTESRVAVAETYWTSPPPSSSTGLLV